MIHIVFFLLLIFFLSYSKNKADTIFFPYAHASYTYRSDFSKINKANIKSDSTDFSHIFGLDFGFKILLKQHLQIHCEFGADQSKSENFHYANPDQYFLHSYQSFELPFLHHAFLKWGPSFFYFEAGKIFIDNYGPLDLIERSLESGSFGGAAFISWSAATGNSLFGIKSGFTKNESKRSVLELGTAVITKPALQSFQNDNENPCILLILTSSLQLNKLSFFPQIVILSGTFQHLKRFHELGAGFTTSFSLSENIKFNYLNAFALIKNNLQNNTLPEKKPTQISEYGFESSLKTEIRHKVNSFNIITKYSLNISKEDPDSIDHFLSCELAYSFNYIFSILLTPKIQFLYSFDSNSIKPKFFQLRSQISFSMNI